MNIRDGMAENAIACTGADVVTKLIVKGEGKAFIGPDVAARVAADPLADKYAVYAYANGEADVYTPHLHVGIFGESVVVCRIAEKAADERRLSLTREQAIELRDALSVLIENTQQNTGE